MPDVTLTIAFIAGIISFLAPCVLPIIPGFIAYLAGASLDNPLGARREMFLNSLFFVLGFSIVFAALGVLLNTILTVVAYDVQIWLSRIGGILIITFGLYDDSLRHPSGCPRYFGLHPKSLAHRELRCAQSFFSAVIWSYASATTTHSRNCPCSYCRSDSFT